MKPIVDLLSYLSNVVGGLFHFSTARLRKAFFALGAAAFVVWIGCGVVLTGAVVQEIHRRWRAETLLGIQEPWQSITRETKARSLLALMPQLSSEAIQLMLQGKGFEADGRKFEEAESVELQKAFYEVNNYLDRVCSAYQDGIFEPTIVERELKGLLVSQYPALNRGIEQHGRNRSQVVWPDIHQTYRDWTTQTTRRKSESLFAMVKPQIW